MHMHNCLYLRTCKRVLGIELFSNSLFRCFRPSFSSLSDAKHAPGSTIWYIVEPHEGVLVLIEVTSESAVPPPLSVASHPGWRLFALGCGADKSTLSDLAYTCTQYIAIATLVAPNYVIARPRPHSNLQF